MWHDNVKLLISLAHVQTCCYAIREMRLFHKMHAPVSRASGQQVLGSLKNEIPA
jgi:hypothetical protein